MISFVFSYIRKVSFLFALILISVSIKAQKTDSLNINKHSPQKAALYSAVLPGLGQAYNQKYWKIPIIYAGAGVLTYVGIFNHKYYKQYKTAYIKRIDGDTTTIDNYVNKYTENDLLILKNYYRRNFELTIIISAAVYALNIIDATVDGYLFHFDISDDLSMHINPTMLKNHNTYTPGINLTFNIGK